MKDLIERMEEGLRTAHPMMDSVRLDIAEFRAIMEAHKVLVEACENMSHEYVLKSEPPAGIRHYYCRDALTRVSEILETKGNEK